MALSIHAADQNSTNSSSNEVLLTDSLGQTVTVSTNELSPGLRSSAGLGSDQQIPTLTKGASIPDEVSRRLQQQREEEKGIQIFPAVPPLLMPYLAGQDEFGNTAFRPGALLAFAPFESPVQNAKYWFSEHGFRYSLEQSMTYVNMTDVMKGDHSLGYYTFDLQAKWAIFNAPAAGTAGWVSTKVEAKNGFDSASNKQSAKSNLGTVTDPTGIWSSVNGVRVPELAWQESLRDGEIVVVAGMVSQGNYVDQNAYAQSGRSHFINSALINSAVLPEPSYNFGVNLQWQPVDEWHAMLGSSAGNASAGYAPWTDFSFNDWSLIGEFGYAPRNFLGLGPGIYRIQPFIAEAGGSTGGGLCFNLQQKLGARSPFGWYGRFGFGDEDVSAGAAAQIGTGFVVQGPFKHLLFQRTSNDLLGVGFVWSQPSATTKTVYHENEYILETVYAMQLTPTIKLQPDFQVIWNPAHNPNADQAMVFQLQLVMAW
jgi:hypothetical protein